RYAPAGICTSRELDALGAGDPPASAGSGVRLPVPTSALNAFVSNAAPVAGSLASREIVSVAIATRELSARTSVVNLIPILPRELAFDGRSTITPHPSRRAPAGIAVVPSTITSRETFALILSSTFAFSDESA